jgi:hypothetical protein
MHRRQFLAGLAATAAALWRSYLADADVQPEITTIRLAKPPALCVAPQFIVEELLRADGFTDIRYVDTIEPEVSAAVGSGKVDFSMAYASQFVAGLDAGDPVTSLAGVMVGCFELFGNDKVRSIGDLKGKTVGVQAISARQRHSVAAASGRRDAGCRGDRDRCHRALPWSRGRQRVTLSSRRQPGLTANHVRRDKAALSSGCKPHPAIRSRRKQPEQAWRRRNV